MASPTWHFLNGLLSGLVLSFILVGYSAINIAHTQKREFQIAQENLRPSVSSRMLQSKDRNIHLVSDNETVAMKLKKQILVLVLVITSPDNIQKRAKAVKETWGRRCHKLVFLSSKNNEKLPAVGLNVSEGRNHLLGKTVQAFRYIYTHHLHDADWFMKVDDDTYVVMENLRYFLSNQNTSEPVYFGHSFKAPDVQPYNSGGAGYVLSKEALIRFGKKGNDSSLCSQDGNLEDLYFGQCLNNLGVGLGDTNDYMGRSRFHALEPHEHIFGIYAEWYRKNDFNGAKQGQDSISNYVISFHYISPNCMMMLEFYIYHIRVYGTCTGDTEVNQNRFIKG